MNGRRVAVFGGSFNPPHIAHVLVAAYVLSVCEVDEFLVVPCFVHPFAKELAPFEDRFEMCRMAFSWLPGASVSRVEQELGGESRTLRTLQRLQQHHPEWRLRLVVGADIMAEAPRWFGFDEIRRIAPLIVLGRIGVDEPCAIAKVFPDVSSTQIRRALQQGRIEEARELMPRTVLAYAAERALYERCKG